MKKRLKKLAKLLKRIKLIWVAVAISLALNVYTATRIERDETIAVEVVNQIGQILQDMDFRLSLHSK